MTIVKILGGLGNQMFQYSFAFALSQKRKESVYLDITGFKGYKLRKYEMEHYMINALFADEKDIENLKYKHENFLQKVFRKIKKRQRPLSEKHYYKEPHFHFDEGVFLLEKEDIYFDGYWQSEKYFKEYRENLLNEFTPKHPLHPQSQKYFEIIRNTSAVSIHIRRGDYVSNSITNSKHGTCSIDYYRRAIQLMETQVDSPHFFVFSDDLEWARDNLKFAKKTSFVSLPLDVPDQEEMYLMSICQHNIIANSTFSWWGAWLNKSPDKIVIAPEKWFNDVSINTSDLIPCEWIRL